MDFLIARDDLHRTRFADAPMPELESGQALLAVDAFGLTSNNITYAMFGDAMSYWGFFPAEDGWGRMPVWGFAEVTASRHDAVEPGTRVYGYLPPSTELLIAPGRVGDARVRRRLRPPVGSSRRSTTPICASTRTRSMTRTPRISRCCCGRCSSRRG